MADILLIIFLLAITGAVVAMYHRSEKDARTKIGEAIEIQLYRKWGIVLQRILLALAILFPLVFGTMAVVMHWRFDALFASFLRSFWMLSMVYGIRRSSVLLIGEHGMFAVGLDMTPIPWKDILRIDWDRDIGQQQWGVKLVVRKNGREEKRGLYIHREKKGEVERAVMRFRPEHENISEPVAA